MNFSRFGWVCVALFLGLTGLVNAADAPASFKVGEFEFKRPEKWSWVEPTSPMRKATLKVSSADGKDSAEVVFFHFGPGNGGGTQANVDRWLGQFQEGREDPSQGGGIQGRGAERDFRASAGDLSQRNAWGSENRSRGHHAKGRHCGEFRRERVHSHDRAGGIRQWSRRCLSRDGRISTQEVTLRVASHAIDEERLLEAIRRGLTSKEDGLARLIRRVFWPGGGALG